MEQARIQGGIALPKGNHWDVGATGTDPQSPSELRAKGVIP
jgi:hypothetical protein